jgi:hypothetical protein
VLTDDNDSV